MRVLVALCTVVGCGGIILPEDPAGGPDPRYPRPVGAAGSLCQGWIPPEVGPAPACADNGSSSQAVCDEWAAPFNPPGVTLFGGYCDVAIPGQRVGREWTCGLSTSRIEFPDTRPSGVRCRTGPAGDAYCASVYQELVLGDGKVPDGTCLHFRLQCDDVSPECDGRAGTCELRWRGFSPPCDPGFLPVDRSEGVRCERACAVPP